MPVKIQHVFAAVQRELDRLDAESADIRSTHQETNLVDEAVWMIDNDIGESIDQQRRMLAIAAIACRALRNHGLPSEEVAE